jgi:exportin-2 (importin alpha re-exporter)
MLSTPQLIRAQLSEALTIISSHDFPANWPQLLPELVERLNGAWQQQHICQCQHFSQQA